MVNIETAMRNGEEKEIQSLYIIMPSANRSFRPLKSQQIVAPVSVVVAADAHRAAEGTALQAKAEEPQSLTSGAISRLGNTKTQTNGGNIKPKPQKIKFEF